MTYEESQTLRPGDRVLVSYMTNVTTAEVVVVDPLGRYGPRRGWVLIRHLFDTEHGDSYAGAEYEAAIEYMVREGEHIEPGMSAFGGLF